MLSTTAPLFVPAGIPVDIHLTSADVLHSWAIPSLGIKIDVCPGRLSCTYLYLKKPGVYFGQCSELCGVGHAFMPIEIICLELPYDFYETEKYSRDFLLGKDLPF